MSRQGGDRSTRVKIAHRMLGNEKLWSCTPIDSRLFPRAVEVWAAWLDVEEIETDAFWPLLCRQERERASRFTFERERVRFIAARGLLRTILGTYLDADPHDLEFVYSTTGKPFLGGAFADCGLEFNLAHSGGLGVLAVSRLGAVGVDVEQVRPISEFLAVSEHFFTPRECAKINQLPRHEAIREFFTTWTLKEAWLKATGEGITDLSSSVDSLATPGGQDLHDGSLEGPCRTSSSLYGLAPAPGFLGALAIRNQRTSRAGSAGSQDLKSDCTVAKPLADLPSASP
jgi:4'-phosphopantetheinyl transferase